MITITSDRHIMLCSAAAIICGFLLHASLLTMSLEPLELRDYHVAGRYQHVAVLVGKGARQKSLRETPIGSGFLCPIARSRNDQPVNHFARCATRSVGTRQR
jgi:hypothetical protein